MSVSSYFPLKFLFHYEHITPLRTKDKINEIIKFLQSYLVAVAMLEIGTDLMYVFLSLIEHFSQTGGFCFLTFYHQSMYCYLFRYFLVRTKIAKFFTKSSKGFRREVMFENEHTFRS
jgi:hypothetical protein